MSEEKRREHERAPFEAPLQARCDTWSEFLELYTQNISQGGVFIKHDELPELGVEVTIEIQAPNHQVLRLAGRVAHLVDGTAAADKGISQGFGVEFVNVTEDAVKAIADLLRTAQQHQAAPPPPIPK